MADTPPSTPAATPAPTPWDILAKVLDKFGGDALAKARDATTIKGASIQGTILAYMALGELAEKIAKAAGGAKADANGKTSKPTLLVLSGTALPGVPVLRAFQTRTDAVLEQLAKAIEQARKELADKTLEVDLLSGALVFVPAVVSALLGFATAARTQTSIEHFAVTLDDGALVGMVASILQLKGHTVLTSASLDLLPWDPDTSDLVRALKTMAERSAEARTYRDHIAALPDDADRKGHRDAARSNLAAALDRANAILAAIDTNAQPFGELLRTEALLTKLGAEGRIVLTKVLAGGGSTAFVDKWDSSGEVFHSGGAVAMFTLLDPNGTLLTSHVLPHAYPVMTEEEALSNKVLHRARDPWYEKLAE